MHPKERLAIAQGDFRQGVNFLDFRIGHGKATNGGSSAVDHQGAPGSTMNPIVMIGVSQIHG